MSYADTWKSARTHSQTLIRENAWTAYETLDPDGGSTPIRLELGCYGESEAGARRGRCRGGRGEPPRVRGWARRVQGCPGVRVRKSGPAAGRFVPVIRSVGDGLPPAHQASSPRARPALCKLVFSSAPLLVAIVVGRVSGGSWAPVLTRSGSARPPHRVEPFALPKK